jgi:hypothetical protein
MIPSPLRRSGAFWVTARNPKTWVFSKVAARDHARTKLYPLRREIEDPASVMVSQLDKVTPGVAMQMALGKFFF